MISFFDSMIGKMCGTLAANMGLRLVTEVPNEGYTLACVPGTTDPTQPPVRVYVREQDRHRHDAAPSVCCVPIGGDITRPDRTGGSQQTLIAGKSVQAIRNRQFRTNVYVWGENRGQAEVLYGQLLLAFHGFHNGIEFVDEVWEDQQPGEGGEETHGALISFAAIVSLQVTNLPQGLARIAHVKANVTELSQSQEIDIP